MKKKIIFIAVLGFIILSQPILTQTWSSRKRLTWTSKHSIFPVAAVHSGGKIHIAWVEADSTGTGGEIYYRRTTNTGTSWDTIKRLTWNAGKSQFPAIVVDNNGRVYIFWFDDTPGNEELFYRKSMDGGVSWLSPRRMTYNSAVMESPPFACVDSSNTIHLVYADTTYGDYQILYRNSTNGGQNWSILRRVTWSSDSAIQPKIAVDSNNSLHLVWQDYGYGDNPEILYKKRLSNGTWYSPIRLTWHLQGSYYPFVAIDSAGTIHVVWHSRKSGDDEIYYRRSINGGVTWSSAKRLTWIAGESGGAILAAESNKDLHLVWRTMVGGQSEIYYKKKTFDVGWSSNKRLTWNLGFSDCPYIVVDSNDDVQVFWHDDSLGNAEIFYKYYK